MLWGWLKSWISARGRRVLIVDHAYEAPLNCDYRLQSDADFVIRLNQEWRDGIGAGIFKLISGLRDGIPVAGISHGNCPRNARELIEGTDRQVILVREPTNPHDINAIRVMGTWADKRGILRQGELGWVPREFAKQIADGFDKDASRRHD